MKRAQHVVLGILTAMSVTFAASAGAHPGEGGRMGQGATGQPHAQGQHGAMHAQMAQRMAQRHGEHARGQQSAAGAASCPMHGQADAQGGHKH